MIATESYESFAENLQKEIEADTGIRFGIVERHQFANIPIQQEDGSTAMLGLDESAAIYDWLKGEAFIDTKGKVQDTLRTAIKNGTLTLPEAYAAHLPQVREVLRKIAGRLEIKNADERRQILVRKEVFHSPEFQALWDRVKHLTTYRVQFDNDKLIADCVKAIAESAPIAKARATIRKADLAIGQGGVIATETSTSGPVSIEEGDIVLPDILTDLQDRTQLTRRSLVTILTESDRLTDFKRNPQAFIEQAGELISLFTDDLRDQEAAKIACGAAHFAALAVAENAARYVKAAKLADVLDHA